MSNKIVITGMGAVTPVGIGVDNYWNSLISGVCGIKDISCIDTSSLPIKQAAEVHNFNPKRLSSWKTGSIEFRYL